MLVSAPLSNQSFLDAGSVYIIDPTTGLTLDRIDGEQAGEGLGRYVTSLGDFDGDGTDDLAVSGYYIIDNSLMIGAVWVYSGSDLSRIAEFTGEFGSIEFGRSVFAAGDLNSDGYADLAITSPHAPGALGSFQVARVHPCPQPRSRSSMRSWS